MGFGTLVQTKAAVATATPFVTRAELKARRPARVVSHPTEQGPLKEGGSP